MKLLLSITMLLISASCFSQMRAGKIRIKDGNNLDRSSFMRAGDSLPVYHRAKGDTISVIIHVQDLGFTPPTEKDIEGFIVRIRSRATGKIDSVKYLSIYKGELNKGYKVLEYVKLNKL